MSTKFNACLFVLKVYCKSKNMLQLELSKVTNIRNGIEKKKRLIKRIYMYFKGKKIWNEKMSEPLEIR